MHFSYFTAALLPLLSLTTANPIELRAATAAKDLSSQVQSNLTALASELVTLNTTLNSFADNAATIGFYTLLAIQSQSAAVGSYITNATAASNASSVWTSAESKSIYTYGSNLSPNISSLLNNFAAHKVAFKNQGVLASVVSGLQSQREYTREEGNSFAAKMASPYSGQEPAVTTKILGYFDATIKTLNS